jgi:hypothetical protein
LVAVAVLPSDDQATIARLKARLDRDTRMKTVDGKKIPGFKSLRAYYGGVQRLEQLGIAIPEELRQFITIVAWPRTYADAIVSRLRPQGFLIGGDASEELWRYWQENNLDYEIRMALTDMVVCARGYLCEGSRPDDDEVRAQTPDGTNVSPLITVESPLEMIHEWSNARRRVTTAARFYTETLPNGRREARVTYYKPNQTRWVRRGPNGWEDIADFDPDDHNMGIVPVQPLVNRSSSDDRYGESELHPIIGLTDAAARALTNAQVATEILAVPQRWAAGMTQDDFKDPRTKEVLTAWEAYFGAVWATKNGEAKFGQFAAADLANFKTIIGVYAGLVAGVTGLPMRYLGQQTDNPPSADGIRADESRIIGTAEEKQEFAAVSIERTMVVSDRIATGRSDPELLQLETDWRSAATPSTAQAADAASKLYAQKLISRKQALRDMGYTPKQIEKIIEELEEELAAARGSDPTLDRIAEGLLNAGTDSGV